jgi:hypothetical protein
MKHFDNCDLAARAADRCKKMKRSKRLKLGRVARIKAERIQARTPSAGTAPVEQRATLAHSVS